jgi:HlyD family secretion protein
MKSKLIKAIIAGVVVIAVSVGGYFGYKKVFAKTATVASVQYITSTAKKMNLEVNVQGTGAAYAAATKEVMPNNNGTLSDLSVKIGDTVTAGQKLFTSGSDDLNTAVTTAQNSVTDANINLTSAQNDLAAKQKALADAQAAAAAGTTATDGSQGSQGNSQASKTIDDYKLDVEKAKLTVEQNKLKVTNAKNSLTKAKESVDKMAVKSPIAGVITAVNNSNGDNVQTAKSVLTVVDMSTIKVKVSVDELDIQKIKLGQKAQIKFDAIKDKTYEGAVETIAQTGTTQNNVTTYDVVVAVTNPEGIKLGMNANVTIKVESKENALVIPAEALVESNGKKFVRVESTDSSATDSAAKANNAQGANTQGAATNAQGNNTQAPAANAQGSNAQASAASSQGQNTNRQTANNAQGTRNTQGTRSTQAGNAAQTTASVGKLVEIKTGMENENYIEVTEGLTEGQKVIITLPQTSTTTTNSNKNNNMGGFGGGIPGGAGTQSVVRQRN